MKQTVTHCTEGLGSWQWASNDQDGDPDMVMACCGDTPTLEVLAVVCILRLPVPAGDQELAVGTIMRGSVHRRPD